ncbi:DUF4097 family beta strand repeat-containing protein [Microbacterium sp. YJN-G]|uniref:DUF4097 family beta strand repeat-containing protein n=1 Tax=Microbacterium sp. YJN-G TaxID=2763257 RepID=UPI001878E7F4|nr:DUF4097 family beta strand repeat-containing protein [Microbacterium sp. YJN-G]
MNGTTKKSVGALTVVLAVIGGVSLLGTGAGAAFAGVRSLGPQAGSLEQDVSGVTSLDVEVHGAAMEVEFADVSEAQLRIEGGPSDGWRLSRDDDELDVRGPDRGFDWFRPDWLRGDERATLLLPESLRGLDAELTLEAGSLSVDGEFGELQLDVNAGALTVEGAARMLDAELNAGRADIDLSSVTEAKYSVSAGRITSTLTDAPSQVAITVEAGQLDLTVPDTDYDVRENVSAGSINNGLSQRSDSDRRITAKVSAGSINLRASDD